MKQYQAKIEENTTKIAQVNESLKKLSTWRLAAFIGSMVLILVLANAGLGLLILLVLLLCMVGFGQLIHRYNQTVFQLQHTTFLKAINEQEVLRQENTLAGFPTGQSFLSRDHAYATDVDLFGPHSVFQLLNRTTTESGQVRLAEWLTVPATKVVILERQQAIKELTPKLDWRQDFQATGMPFLNAKSDFASLLAWVEKPVQLLPNQSKYLFVSLLLAVVSTSAAVAFLVHLVQVNYFSQPFSVGYSLALILLVFLNSRILKRVKPIAEEIIESLQQNHKILGSYEALISKIETEPFGTKPLQQIKAVFRRDHYSAVLEINRLKKTLTVFQLRGTQNTVGRNLFYSIFNQLWLLDVYGILLTEKWKLKNRAYLRSWAAAVSEFEVFCSLAGFAHANPGFSFPEIVEEPYCIHFEHLGHPLISPARRVCNAFAMQGRGEIAMITGSNMAGKSTFLRTVGVNLVLALMGAPCCATTARVSVLRLFTSMRTQDNLEEGVSSFYAELKRIEQLLKLIESGQAIFFLLDEMFKGTNSQDRYKGGVSLIKQLNELNAFGLISTHDLELANVVGNHMAVANYSFNSEIKGSEINFNYQLTPGLCTDFNASELMKRSGIKILSSFDKMKGT
ncbi:MutS-related protein [Larkinella humicola]|uniref:DNA mismatch repair protein MutS n=1 Tax=Larkinella humicola TaxID=2607654 RepID=A0A5N1JRF7_9BACT|nr:DNA mismatch repair protein MutS [Larkinella humicola]KAA9356413.1 DNA mismatch repair protein MutS [Larkinella humicola]